MKVACKCTVEHLHACVLYIVHFQFALSHFLSFSISHFTFILHFSIFYFQERGYVLIDICFVSYLAGLCKNYSPDVHKIQWKGGTWTRKKRLDLVGDPHHGTLGLGLATSYVGALHSAGLSHTRDTSIVGMTRPH